MSKIQKNADKKKMNNKKQNDKKNKLRKNRPDSDDDEESEYEEEESEYEEEESDSSESEYIPKKKNKSSSSNRRRQNLEEDEEDDDDYYDDNEDDNDDEGDIHSYNKFQKLLFKMFPSKFMKEKASLSEKRSKERVVSKSKVPSKNSMSQNKKQNPKKRRVIRYQVDDDDDDDDEDDYEDIETEDEDEDDDDDDDEDDTEDYEEDVCEDADEKGVYNIVFSMDGGANEEYLEEDDDDDCDSDDEAAFMKEKYERVETLDELVPADTKKARKAATAKKAAKAKKAAAIAEESADVTDVEQEYIELLETKKTLINQLKKKPTSKILKNAIKECDSSIKELVKNARSKNAKAYHELVHGATRKHTNEMDYFKKKLSNKEQLQVMKELKQINSYIDIEKPYRFALLDSTMPPKFKAIALQKLNVLRSMDPGDNEYYKIKTWVDTFMRIPFGIHKSLTVRMEDGMDKCQAFMENAKDHLDSCVYGLDDAKMQIMQMIGQWIANPAAMGTAIAIKGPMGSGKTTLVKEGISKILGREFTFIALGGTGDSSFLEGHSYTYEGSTWGKIVQILIDSKCMNPVIYFDELDKISDTPRGQEIVGILTHLTDTSQNNQFHDKYFSEVEFDLSKCLFIFSYNDESMVNPILRDRMYRIETKGYDSKSKTVIARDYLLPKIREQVNFKDEDIIIPDDTIQYIVSNKALTNDESGVRNLKRCLEIIHTKLNLFRLMKPDAKVFGKDLDIKVEFPFTVTRKEVDIFIKNEEKQNQSMLAMYC
jgi:ATP-dependent Lon protease